jgi:hypothetical protein
MAAVLAYVAEVSGVLSFPLSAVAAWVPARKWLRGTAAFLVRYRLRR